MSVYSVVFLSLSLAPTCEEDDEKGGRKPSERKTLAGSTRIDSAAAAAAFGLGFLFSRSFVWAV